LREKKTNETYPIACPEIVEGPNRFCETFVFSQGRCGDLDGEIEIEAGLLMTDTNKESVITADNDAVVTETYVDAPPERVFKALTDSAELARWFTNPECPAATAIPPTKAPWW
jgi:Activator of Hsp90 ATPase homolog 1-like protein